MMNLASRIEKLEQQITEDMDASDVNLELFDVHGEKVENAKILRMPKDWECGLAILPDGTEIEIAPIGNWRDIVLESERLLNRENSKIDDGEAMKADYSDVLFLRRNGQIGAVEMIYGAK